MNEGSESCKRGLLAHRAGRLAEAQGFYERALELDPRCADAFHLLGVLKSDRGEDEAALALYDRALALKPAVPFFQNRAESCRRLGRLDEALKNLNEALAIQPKAAIFVARAAILRLLGQLSEAERDLWAAEARDPDAPGLAHQKGLLAVAQAVQAVKGSGREPQDFESSEEAQAHFGRAIGAFEAELTQNPDDPEALAALSALWAERGEPQKANQMARRALQLSGPTHRPAHPQSQPGASAPPPSVLAIHALSQQSFHLHPADGQVVLPKDTNLPQLLPPEFALTEVFLDALPQTLTIPRNAVIWNAVGEPGDAALAAAFLQKLPKMPVINAPEKVALTDREQNAQRLCDLYRVRFPKTLRVEAADGADLAEKLSALGFEPPFLLRRPGTQAGRSLKKIERFETLLGEHRAAFAGSFLAIEFIDFADRDGLYSKLRVFVVDGELCPSLYTTDAQWNIHAASRAHLMFERPDLQAREAAFVNDPESVLGAELCEALRTVAAREGLDVCGIDFALSPPDSERAVIFEVNAAMAQNPSRLRDFPYLRPAFQKLSSALARLMYARAGL